MSRSLALILLVAAIARAAAWGVAEMRTDASRPFVVAGDAEGYWDLAGDLAAGREYAVHQPPRQVMRTPGLPVAIAASRLVFGDSIAAARGGLAALSLLSPLGVYWLGRLRGDARLATLAGLFAAISPLVVAFSPLLLSESLFGVAIVWQMVAWAWLLDATTTRTRIAAVAAIAATGAAACYLRPAWTPAMAAMPFVWIALRRTKRSAIEAAGMATAFLLLWSPWIARNVAVVGHPVLTTLWTGPTLFDSVGPQADGTSDMTFFDDDAAVRRTLTEAEVNAWYTERSVEAIADDPLRLVPLAAAKQRRFWALAPTADEAGPAWLRLPIAAWTLAFFAACLFGLKRVDRATAVLAAGPVLALAAIHLVFVASLRYRVPCELPLCVLAAAGLRPWVDRICPTPSNATREDAPPAADGPSSRT